MAGAKEQAALMALDDFDANPEAEAGTVDSFGGEEGVEHAGAGRSGDAGAGIGDGEGEAVAAGAPVGGLATAKKDAATGGHRVDGIGDEVVEDLADVAFKTGYGAIGLLSVLDLDGGVAKAAFVEAENCDKEIGTTDLAG